MQSQTDPLIEYFLHFIERVVESKEPRFPLPQPNQINYFKINGSKDIKSLNLINGFNWYDKLNEHWDIGEKAAQKNYLYFSKMASMIIKMEEIFLLKKCL